MEAEERNISKLGPYLPWGLCKSGSYLPECLHFKEPALRSLGKQFLVVDSHLKRQGKNLK